MSVYQNYETRIQRVFQAGKVPLLWGPPGVGKTQIITNLAKKMGLLFRQIILSHCADNEIHGQPVIKPEKVYLGDKAMTAVEQAPPAYVIEAINAKANGYKGALLFFDELTTMPPSSAGPALAIFDTPRRIGGLELPDHVCVAAAANPSLWAAGGWDLTLPSVRRFNHIKFMPDVTSWASDFPGYWNNPPKWEYFDKVIPEEAWAPNRALVAAFVQTHPDAFMNIPAAAAHRTGCSVNPDNNTFECGGVSNPATLEAVSRALTLAELYGDDKDALLEDLKGYIGVPTATLFAVWRENLNVPKPQEVLNDPAIVSKIVARKEHTGQLYYIAAGCVELVRHTVRSAKSGQRALNAANQAYLAGWEIATRIALGDIKKTAYKTALDQAMAKTDPRPLNGPLDIAAVMARNLANAESHPPKFDFRLVREIDLFPAVPQLAGVDWSPVKGK